MTPCCPLCGCSKLQLIEKIRATDISKIYMRLYAINVTEYFGGFAAIEFYQCSECFLLFYYPLTPGNYLLYENLQEFDWYYAKDKSEFKFSRQFIRAEDAVLEVGCGQGWFAKFFDTKNYVGLELNKKARAVASSSGHTVYLQTVEDHQITASEKYDVVCSFQVLEHVENPESFIKSCINCLKPGGMLIISVPSENSYLSIVEDGILNMPPHHLTRWTDKTLTWMANKNGLKVISLMHERLADVHVSGYATEMIRAVIKKIFHMKTKCISTTVSHRFMTFICQILGNCYARTLSNSDLRPVGDSVTLVAKKVTRL